MKDILPQHIINYIKDTRLVVRIHNQVKPGCVFVLASIALSDVEKIDFIKDAMISGAKFIITDIIIANQMQCEVVVGVQNPSLVWAFIASILYDKAPQCIAAVTGTSGKTSVSYIYSQITAIIAGKALYIGTLGALKIKSDLSVEKISETLTTPDAMQLRSILFDAQDCHYACIEASSHGIEQNRVAYIPMATAGFTNLSSEHLDYHSNIANYFQAKEKLFIEHNIENFVLNSDDEYAMKININNKNVIKYGKTGDLKLVDLHPGQSMKIQYNNQDFEFKYHLLGEYNAYNFLCAVGMLLQSGFKIDEILQAAHKISLPEGRMQKIYNENLEVYVDYAHKPDALKAALNAIINYRDTNSKGKIWVVFGCGGDRDRSKRPIMGSIASSLADCIVITDDNPRHEEPSAIRKEIISGIKCQYIEIPDRKSAIEYAITNATKNDILLIAGKGHEKYQIIGNTKTNFCDIATTSGILSKI
jgi:UDP-N-acetylmuramoyl-L-alanyl-D-glutamate--2,6-diaminopimelate ligase